MHPLLVAIGFLFVPFVAVLGAALGLSIGYIIYGEDYDTFKNFAIYHLRSLEELWKSK